MRAPAGKDGWIDPNNWGSNLDNSTNVFAPGFAWGVDFGVATSAQMVSDYFVEVDVLVECKGRALY